MGTATASLAIVCLSLIFLLAGLPSGQALTQGDLDRMATDLDIKARVVDNLRKSAVSHDVIIELTNSGSEAMPGSDWTLYFHSMYLLFPKTFPKNMSIVPDGQHVNVSMIQGDLYALQPVTPSFGDLAPGQTRTIQVTAAVWSISRTDFMPLWYLTAGSLEPRVVKATASMDLEYVEPFDDVRQWKRYQDDRFNPFTAQARARRLAVENTGKIDKPVIPTPKHIGFGSSGKTVTFDRSMTVYAPDQKLSNEVNYLKDYGLSESGTQTERQVRLLLNDTLNSEGYGISMNPDSNVITITGQSTAAVFYGIQTLLSLNETYQTGQLPELSVLDEPRFESRGISVDVVRNFHTVEDMKRLMDAMAMYKMNSLHWRLADDEGWRLEIPGLEELTQVGGKRCHDLTETHCVIPQFGSGPDNSSSGSGFYTVAEYQDLLRYANDRHIEVVPEFDTPGHAHAAIVSMEARYRKMESSNITAAEHFRLKDPGDMSVYISVQNWLDNAVNPCIESTYNFVRHVATAVKEIHKDIQPLKVYHFGGDEVPGGAWSNSPKCDEFLSNNPTYNISKGLKMYYAHRVGAITKELGLELRGWEDGFMDGDGLPFNLTEVGNDHVSVNAWDNIWEWGVAQRAYQFANAGYKVVMSQATHLYLDHPHEPDPEERGLYWATRFTDTRKVFGFLPDSLYDNIDTRRSGAPLTKAAVCGADMAKCERLENADNIIGMQGNMFSETIRTSADMDSQIFPRLLAMAERAWHQADFETSETSGAGRQGLLEEGWKQFANTLGHKELRRLDEMGIQYRVPPPGASIDGTTVTVTTTFPGLHTQHSWDEGATWRDDADIQWQENKRLLLRTRSALGARYSRVIEVQKSEPLATADESTVKYISENLAVKLDVVNNLLKDADGYVDIKLTFRNNGSRTIHPGTWQIWVYSLYGLKPETLDCHMTVHHDNGALFFLTADQSFAPLEPEETLTCTVHNHYWIASRTDNMPNWYVAAPGMKALVLTSTAGESLSFVGSFDTPQKWKRLQADTYDPYTTRARYEMYDVSDMKGAGGYVIPTPSDVTVDPSGSVSFQKDEWVVLENADFTNEVKFISDTLSISTQRTSPTKRYIRFVRATERSADPEAYELKVNAQTEVIEIAAAEPAGAFYGAQSVISLVEGHGVNISHMTINDKPRFSHRGLMIDVSRNFRSKAEVFKVLNTMAMYKLNRLHIHLSDNEGWRLEIPDIPELTQIGSKRCHDPDYGTCNMPSIGSGPDSSSSGSGHYTVSDYREILQYAQDRHVVILPEIEMPGHARAAVHAMEEREERLRKQGNTNYVSYRLIDGKNDVLNLMKWKDNTINPCLNSSYAFIEKVVREIKKMHADIQPLKVFHIGGDEVTHGAWDPSPSCKQEFANVPKESLTAVVHQHFVTRVTAIVESLQLSVAAWGDGMVNQNGQPIPKADLAARDLYALPWDNVWEKGNGRRAYQFANAGYKVVLAYATHLYFDHTEEPDPEEPGLYWATRFIDTKKTFGFQPRDIYANADYTLNGEPISIDEMCADDDSCPKLTSPNNIIGMQACIWADVIRNEERYEYMAFPRILALAERAWHEADWEKVVDKEERMRMRDEDWKKFANTLAYQELPRLEGHDIKYRVTPPGAVVEDGVLKLRTLYPGTTVEMFNRESREWEEVSRPKQLGQGRHSLLLRSRSSILKRTSRVVSIETDITSGARPKYSSLPVLMVLFHICLFILVL